MALWAFDYTYMLEATEPVEKTILGNVICEETAADDADPELDNPAGVKADAPEDELSIGLSMAIVEGSEVVEVALVM
jgi:hypothetical protein